MPLCNQRVAAKPRCRIWWLCGQYGGLLLALLFSQPAAAHLLKVFAWAEGQEIVGNAYFAGGIPAAGAHIKILDAQQQLVLETQPDAKGLFRVKVPAAADYQVVADTEDGHVAHWQIQASELTPSPATGTSPAASAVPSSTVDIKHSAASETLSGAAIPSAVANVDNAALAQLVQTAVAKEVGPLRLELQHYADRVRLSDLLGGIGTIFGIVGCLLWWRSRQRP